MIRALDFLQTDKSSYLLEQPVQPGSGMAVSELQGLLQKVPSAKQFDTVVSKMFKESADQLTSMQNQCRNVLEELRSKFMHT